MDDIGIKKIKNFLLERGLITVDSLKDLEMEANQSGKTLEEILVFKKVFSSGRLAEIKGQVFGLPVANLGEVVIDGQVLNLLTPKVAQNYQMIIFEKKDQVIKIGLVNPGDFRAHEAIEFLVKQQSLEPDYFVISLADFKFAFKQYSGFKDEIKSALKLAEEKFSTQNEILGVVSGKQDLEQAVKAAPVAKIISVIIQNAVEGGASDIHIEPGFSEARVRYRVDGILHTSLNIPSYLHHSLVSRIKVLANLKLDETRVPQDGRIRLNVNNQDVDLRVSILPMLDAEKVVMRVLDTSAGVPTLAELGFSQKNIDIIDRNVKKPHGLFLLTGPTGSGKTTTLYSILNILNGDNTNITTLEDPIEYYISGVNQSQIRSDIGFTFANGLRSVLRQDPNIIMVGEIRDNETAELVIHAALTGHLVFSTLHTNNAVGAIPRLFDMNVERFLLASTLNLVMAQRLVRKICPECRAEIKASADLKKSLNEELLNIPAAAIAEFNGELKFYRGAGCANCNNTGYVGRTVVGEIIEVSNDLRELIAGSASIDKIIAQLKKEGYINLIQDGILKALKGVTTLEEVMRVARE